MIRGTDIIVLLDKSASMDQIYDAVVKGFNQFLKEQKQGNVDPCAISLYQFSDQFETTYEEIPIEDAPLIGPHNFAPTGYTALYDAIGRTLRRSEGRLEQLPMQPGKVLFLVITDGDENYSKEFTLPVIQKMVEEFKKRWQFVYLGANQNSFEVAGKIGFDKDAIMNYQAVHGSVMGAYQSLSDSVSRYRKKEIEEKGSYFLPSEQKK
jgi:hypothetical protein